MNIGSNYNSPWQISPMGSGTLGGMVVNTASQNTISLNSVDTGWINDENPLDKASKTAEKNNFQTPIGEQYVHFILIPSLTRILFLKMLLYMYITEQMQMRLMPQRVFATQYSWA